MSQSRLIAIPCRISPGVVSDERAFEVQLADKTTYGAVAPVYYFWNGSGKPLGKDEPSGEDEIDGKVAARLLEIHNGTALVSIPDGGAIVVGSASITERPSEVVIYVPV